MTPLDKTLKRSLTIGGMDYVITLTPEVLKLTRKGRRLGIELKWADITSGESGLALALQASIGRLEPDSQTATQAPPSKAAPQSIRRVKRAGRH